MSVLMPRFCKQQIISYPEAELTVMKSSSAFMNEFVALFVFFVPKVAT